MTAFGRTLLLLLRELINIRLYAYRVMLFQIKASLASVWETFRGDKLMNASLWITTYWGWNGSMCWFANDFCIARIWPNEDKSHFTTIVFNPHRAKYSPSSGWKFISFLFNLALVFNEELMPSRSPLTFHAVTFVWLAQDKREHLQANEKTTPERDTHRKTGAWS